MRTSWHGNWPRSLGYGHDREDDVLLNNAGGTFATSKVTADGHEPNFQINHLSPFLLTHLLRPTLVAAGSSLVVHTASIANNLGKVVLDDLDNVRRRTGENTAYATSKLMNILFTRGISQRCASDGIVAVAVHPGAVASSFGSSNLLANLLYRTPVRYVGSISVPDGAAPLIALAEQGADPALNGRYFSRLKPDGRQNKQARDQAIIDGLWERSAALVGLA